MMIYEAAPCNSNLVAVDPSQEDEPREDEPLKINHVIILISLQWIILSN